MEKLKDKTIEIIILIDIVIFYCLIFIGISHAETRLHNQWGELLAKYVVDGIVDYQGIKKDEDILDTYLEKLNKTDIKQLSQDEQLALYINAYNACTIKLILDNFHNDNPVSSIKRIGFFFSGPWDISFCAIGGTTYTLDHIEHTSIRPVYKDPRVHFAVNCASKSCPPLISVPYQADIIDQQLTQNTVAFVNNSKRNYLHEETLYVSKIFKWFGEDFEEGVVPFFIKYGHEKMKKKLESKKGNIRVEYLNYDWSLNDR